MHNTLKSIRPGFLLGAFFFLNLYMKLEETNKDFALIHIHLSELDMIADYFSRKADEETEKSKGFFTRNAGDFNRIAQFCSKTGDEIRRKIRKNEFDS